MRSPFALLLLLAATLSASSCTCARGGSSGADGQGGHGGEVASAPASAPPISSAKGPLPACCLALLRDARAAKSPHNVYLQSAASACLAAARTAKSETEQREVIRTLRTSVRDAPMPAECH